MSPGTGSIVPGVEAAASDRPQRVLTRRSFLVLTCAGLAAACVRPEPRALPAPPSEDLVDLKRWEAESRAIVVESLPLLRVFEEFSSYRLSAAPQSLSPIRSDVERAWFPPLPSEWEAARQAARGLSVRSETLHEELLAAPIKETVWREQREMAEITLAVSRLGEGLGGFSESAPNLPAGEDGTATHKFLDLCWGGWTEAASRLGVDRAETIGCA